MVSAHVVACAVSAVSGMSSYVPSINEGNLVPGLSPTEACPEDVILSAGVMETFWILLAIASRLDYPENRFHFVLLPVSN